MRKLRIGVIGLGGIANFHIAGIHASSDAEVWSLCDCNEEALNKRARELSLPSSRLYTDLEVMLRDPELDAVFIGTPNFNHFEAATAAIRHRKPFALEKPVSLDTWEAAELADLLTKDPLPHMVCFSYRYKGAVRYAKRLIEEGKLGTIRHVYSQYLQGWAIDPEVPLFWRFRKSLSGSGALGDLGSHIFDLERFLVGDIERVVADADTIVKERPLPEGGGSGEVDVDDYCHVLARLEGGVSSAMTISRFAYGRGNYQRIEIYGSKGALVYDLEQEDTLHVRLKEENDETFRQVEIPDAYRADQMQSFFHLLNGKGDGLDPSIQDGYINQATIDAVIASFEEGRWVDVKREVPQHG